MEEKKLSVDELILGLLRKEDFTEEELNIIFNTQANAAKIWLKNHGFVPDVSSSSDKKALAKFQQDIEDLTIDPAYPGTIFWSIVYTGICAYVTVAKGKERQKHMQSDREFILGRFAEVRKLQTKIDELAKRGLIEPVNICISPRIMFIGSDIAEFDPQGIREKLGKPMTALATNMAFDLTDLLKMSKNSASKLVSDFINLYFPDEPEMEQGNIRKNLNRSHYPSSIIRFPAQKTKTKK